MGKRPINAETAFALATFFDMRGQFGLNLQSQHELRRVELEQAPRIRARIQPLAL